MRKEQIEQAIQQFLSGQMPLDAFRHWFPMAYVQVWQDLNAPHDARQLCGQIVGPLAEFSRGDRSEESFRKALEFLVPASMKVIEFGPDPKQPHALATNSRIQLEASIA